MERNSGRNLIRTGVVLALATLNGGCIAYLVPINSWESGSIGGYEFEAHIGSTKEEIRTELGQPTYVLTSQELDETYYLYESDRFVESEWGRGHVEFPKPIRVEFDSGRFTDKDGKSCYLLVFSANNSLVRYEADWIRYSPGSATED